MDTVIKILKLIWTEALKSNTIKTAFVGFIYGIIDLIDKIDFSTFQTDGDTTSSIVLIIISVLTAYFRRFGKTTLRK